MIVTQTTKPSVTRQHPDQVSVTIISVTLPNGAKQEFTKFANGRVYVGTTFWTQEQFSVGLEKMRSAGATITEQPGFAWE